MNENKEKTPSGCETKAIVEAADAAVARAETAELAEEWKTEADRVRLT